MTLCPLRAKSFSKWTLSSYEETWVEQQRGESSTYYCDHAEPLGASCHPDHPGELRQKGSQQTLRHYCLGELFSFPSEGKTAWMSLIRWNAEEFALRTSVAVESSVQLGRVTVLCEGQVPRGNSVDDCWEVLGKPYPRPMGFLTGKMGVLQGLVQGTAKPLRLIISSYRLYAWNGFLAYG